MVERVFSLECCAVMSDSHGLQETAILKNSQATSSPIFTELLFAPQIAPQDARVKPGMNSELHMKVMLKERVMDASVSDAVCNLDVPVRDGTI